MIHSLRYSYLAFRLGLAAVFIWIGISKFFDVQYWLSVGGLRWAMAVSSQFGIPDANLVYFLGVLEIVIGISLLTGVLIRTFSVTAIIILVAVLFSTGINELTVRDLGLIGSLCAILLWPPRKNLY